MLCSFKVDKGCAGHFNLSMRLLLLKSIGIVPVILFNPFNYMQGLFSMVLMKKIEMKRVLKTFILVLAVYGHVFV